MKTSLKNVATTNHQGTVITFAQDSAAGSTDLYYNVLDLSLTSSSDNQDWTGFTKLPFPELLRPVGMGIVTTENDDGVLLGFADAPIKVVSDQQYVCVFRQSTKNTLLLTRFMLRRENAQGTGAAAPVLEPAWEVRFERSGKEDVPASTRDTQNFLSPDGAPFIEPTLELPMIKNLGGGGFDALLLPNESNGSYHWQFFALDSVTGRINLFNFPADEKGLFDLEEKPLDADGLVAPDGSFSLGLDSGGGVAPLAFAPGLSSALYSVQERVTSEDGESTLLKRSGRALLAVSVAAAGEEPVMATVDFAVSKTGTLARIAEQTTATRVAPANYALDFDRHAYVTLTNNQDSLSIRTSFRIECLIYPDSGVESDQFVLRGDAGVPAERAAPYLQVTRDLRVAVGFGDGSAAVRCMTAGAVIAPSVWTQLTVIYDAAAPTDNFSILINGQRAEVRGAAAPNPPFGSPVTTVSDDLDGFVGVVDGLRIQRTDGQEPVTLGQWAFDSVDYAPAVPTTPDASESQNTGLVYGAKLVPSSSPISADTAGALQVDPSGLTIYSGVLDFVRPGTAPSLLNGSDGLVHLYFGDRDGWFCVAQYDAEAARAVFESAWSAEAGTGRQTGTLRFLAARSGTFMNRSTIRVAPSGHPELCDVEMDNHSGRREVWRGVPRDLDTFLDVLNGQTTSDPDDPQFSSGRVGFYDNFGLYPVSRLKANSDVGDVAVVFLSRFPAVLPLHSVAVEDVSEASCTVVLQYDAARWQAAGANIITQRWRGVPVYAVEAPDVLNGLSGRYDYSPTDTGTSAVYRLRAAAAVNDGVEHDVLIMTREGVSNFSVGVTDGAAAGLCNVTISLDFAAAPLVQQWADVPREQAAFAAALQAGGQVSDLILILTDRMEAYVGNHDPALTRPADMLAWASVFNVYNDGLLRGVERLAQQPAVPAAILQKAFYVEEGGEVVLPDGSTLFGAVAYTTPTNGGVALVRDTAAYTGGDADLITPAVNGGWVRESPRKALGFSGTNAISFDISRPSADHLTIAGDMSVAVWCRPPVGLSGDVRLLNFNRRGTADLPDELVQYCVGLSPSPCLRLGQNTQISGAYNLTAADPECTLQLLVNPDAGASGQLLALNTIGVSQNFLRLSIDAQRRAILNYADQAQGVAGKQPLKSGRWQQLAGTLRALPGQGKVEIRLYVDGVEQGTAVLDRKNFSKPPGAIALGSTSGGTPSARVNGVLMWERALTAEEVSTSFGRAVEPDERGLVNAWYLTEGAGEKVVNLAVAGMGLTSTIINPPAEPWSGTGAYCVPFAGNRDYALKAPSGLLLGGWRQIASVYRAGHAIRLRGGDFGDCGNDSSQNLDTTLSLEAWLEPEAAGRVQSVISKYGGYKVELGVDNFVVFRLWTSAGKVELRSTSAARPGAACYVAATVKTGPNETSEQESKLTYFLDARLYVNSDPPVKFSKTDYTDAVSISASKARLTFGRSSRGGAPYTGYISDVRLWERELSEAEVRETFRKHFAPAQQDGLISSWSFGEMSGKVAYDANDLNNAVLSDNDLWSIFAPSAALTLFVDGVEQEEVIALRAADVGGYGPEQFTVGALRGDGGAFAGGIPGQLDEVRVWSTAQTAEEISDDMQRTLSGKEQGLAGYWKFDNGSGAAIDDETGRGNNGVLSPADSPPAWLTSTAPLSNEAEEVYNVLGGVRTPFQRRVSGAPSAVEYADTQHDAYGQIFSVMKRCYASVMAGEVHLVAGYKVDDLDTVYAGQVQTKPSLVGFIEGAPPIPSENQTIPYWSDGVDINSYAGSASVQLQQADSSVTAFSGSENRGDATNISSQLGLYLTTGVSTSIGIGVETSIDVFSAESHLGYGAETQNGRQAGQELGFSYGKTTTFTDAVSPGGAWEDPGAVLNPEVGRRYVPSNTGYALVKSLTADLYMVRLKGAGTVIKFTVVPNLDIPEDVNIIEFPIDPHYTKNGTLDGKVGFANDPDYPYSDVERGSYFKPLEAYRLKRQVEKQDKQLEAYFRQFDPGSVSRGRYPSNAWAATGKNSGTNLGAFQEKLAANPSYDWQRGLAKRNLVNTYVWTSGGGFHSEQESVMDTYTESFTGLSDWSASQGLHFDLSAAAFAGVYGEFDALFSSTLEVSAMKSSESDQSYGLGVELRPEWFLRRPVLDEQGQPAGYAPGDAPGKVNAYRFMSFFLAPSEDNHEAFFNKVVDRHWLLLSSNPNAAALRQATASANGAWRVLHRVTYVSRVPQQFMPVPAETFAPAVTPPANLANNTLITRLVERTVGDDVHNPTPAEIGRALDEVLGESEAKPGLLARALPWWVDFLRAAADVRGDAYRTLLVLRNDLLGYMIEKYTTDAYRTGASAPPSWAAPRATATHPHTAERSESNVDRKERSNGHHHPARRGDRHGTAAVR